MKRTYTDPNGVTYDKLDKLCSAWNITTAQYYTRKYAHKDWTLEQILTMKPMKGSEVIDHTGEERFNNEGKRMVIVACPNAHNMTVLFPDSGFERSGVYYTDFLRGMVKERLSLDKRRKSRIGERKQQNNGSWCEIIEYNNCNDVVVLFDNGHKIRTDYYSFQRGELGDGTNYHIKNLTGRSYSNSAGETYTVVEDMGNELKLRFENGVDRIVPRSMARCGIHSGALRENKKYKVGQFIKNKNGDKYTIIKLYSRDNQSNRQLQYVDVDGPDGIEVHVTVTAIRARKVRLSERKKNKSETIKKRNRIIGEKFIESVIGQRSMTACNTPITIIGGTGKGDITVTTDDGRIIEHQKYYKFVNKQVSIRYEDTIHAKNRKKYLGMKHEQLIGYVAEIIEYNSCENIVVRFEDGKTAKTNIYRFTHGLVPHPKVKAASNTSLNEFTLYYVFGKAGFSKKPIHDSTIPELEGKELDLFNRKLKIAIEYDGWLHKNQKKRDKEKDKLCRTAGITVYRIRESKVGLLNDSIANEIQLTDDHYFSPALREAISRLSDELRVKYDCTIQVPDLSCDKVKRDVIEQFSERAAFKRHIGESKLNFEGVRMTIIDYRGYNRIDVQFENGYIAENTSMGYFRSGRIKCIWPHVGECYTTRMGHKITIIADVSKGKVDIQFDDGTVLKNQNYCAVKSGKIAHPNRYEMSLEKYIGQEIMCKNGMKCKVIDAVHKRNSKGTSAIYVDVRYEDGTIIKSTEKNHAFAGDIRKPGNINLAQKNSSKCQVYFSKLRTEAKERYMSQEYISKDGYSFKVVRYHDDGHLRIKFSDGYELNTKGFMVKNGSLLRHTGINKPRNTVDFDKWVAEDLAKKKPYV